MLGVHLGLTTADDKGEPTQGSTLTTGHETTQGYVFGAEHEPAPKAFYSVRGTNPSKPTPGIDEGGVCSPQARMR